MQTEIRHNLRAADVSANHNWSGNLELIVDERSGDTETKIVVTVTPKQMQDLLRRGRNALIDAKVIRGAKKY